VVGVAPNERVDVLLDEKENRDEVVLSTR